MDLSLPDDDEDEDETTMMGAILKEMCEEEHVLNFKGSINGHRVLNEQGTGAYEYVQ